MVAVSPNMLSYRPMVVVAWLATAIKMKFAADQMDSACISSLDGSQLGAGMIRSETVHWVNNNMVLGL